MSSQSTELKAANDKSIVRFCRQYLQLEPNLDFPSGQVLCEEDVQSALYETLFADGALAYPPPPRYQLRVLKDLMPRIESSISDWEKHGVSDDLMNRFSELLASPLPSEMTAVQQKSYVTYSLSLLGDKHQNIGHSPSITLLETPNLISAAGTTGFRTWEAALHLGQYLCTLPSLIQGKRVLELGAGTGYLSILCAKYFNPKQVIASDGSDDVVLNLPENFYLNGLQDSYVISAMDVKWGYALMGTEEEKWNGGRAIDVVLGADITYDDGVIPSLVAMFENLCELFPETTILIAATERNRQTFETFLRVCQQGQFTVAEVEFELPRREQQTSPFYNDQVPIRICQLIRARYFNL